MFGQFIHGSQGTFSYIGSQRIVSFAQNNMRAKRAVNFELHSSFENKVVLLTLQISGLLVLSK